MIGGIIVIAIFLGICVFMIYSTIVEVKKLKEEERRTKIILVGRECRRFEIKKHNDFYRVYVNGKRIHEVTRIEINMREIIITHN